jgi:hypothetical protein
MLQALSDSRNSSDKNSTGALVVHPPGQLLDPSQVLVPYITYMRTVCQLRRDPSLLTGAETGERKSN